MKPIVSVIVPVYKVESFIERCVDHIIQQNLKNMEIILVDDGSPDNCPQICDNYARKDDRIKVMHKENGGLASARNTGMHIAKGKYIFFVDSDDWIDEETLECLVNIAEQYEVDFVRFRPMYAGWPNRKDGTLCDFGTEDGIREGVYTKLDIIREIYPRLFATPKLSLGVIVAAWRSLYRRQFIEENALYFDEEIRYSEDTIFSAKVVRAAESFYYLDGAHFYHYFFNPSSITKSFRGDRWDSYKKLIQCFERDFNNIVEFDFTSQLRLQKLYCIVSALGQRKEISNMLQREEYCKMICNDPITVEALRYVNLVKTSWKERLLLELVRFKYSKLVARL